MIGNKDGIWCNRSPRMRGWSILWMLLVGHVAYSSSNAVESYCTTDACKETAETMLKNIDSSVDPCEDFFEFACGNFAKRTVIQPGQTKVVVAQEINKIILDRFIFLLEQPISPEDIRPFVLAKRYYNSCKVRNSRVPAKDAVPCALQIHRDLDIAFAAMYVRQFITKEVKVSIDDVTKHLREAFIKAIENTEWLDEATKSYALEKAHAIRERIAFPPEYFNDTALEQYYFWLEFPEGDDFDAILLATAIFNKVKTYFKNNYGKLDLLWTDVAPVEVGATYYYSFNYLIINPGILAGRMFHPDWPAYRNFGGIGMVVGHEFLHSVDNEGSQYDKNGKIRNWWMPKAKQAYEEATKCIFDQYAGFVDRETQLHVDANSTLDENVADSGGIAIAYSAYKRATEHTTQQLLPGLEQYSTDQLFWISAANTWCDKLSMEARVKLMTEDWHSLNRFRVNGAFSNSEQFAQDFKCATNSTMNRPEKCKW